MKIEVVIPIDAPPRRCFDLARSVDLHLASAAQTGEKAVAGRTTGLLERHDEVTFQGRHFGLLLTLTSRITEMDAPAHFQDRMVRGPLARLVHDHYFADDGRGGTVMRDVFDFAAPVPLLGRCAEVLFLGWYFRRFLEIRNREIQTIAESSAWRQFVPEARY